MLAPRVKLPPDQRSLLDNYLKLDQSDRESLRAFAEFLVSRSLEHAEPAAAAPPAEPKSIPRPKKETVIGAIKRLSETYYMIDRQDLLTETSSLMSAHIMHGRAASEVIDDLEALFVSHYKRHNDDGGVASVFRWASSYMRYLTQWFKRYFSDPEVVFLTIFLLILFAVVLTMGDMLAPVLASLVIAYLLEGLVGMIERKRIPRFIAVSVVYLAFLLFVTLLLFVVMPQLYRQLTELFQQIPLMITEGQKLLMQLPQHYPEFISPDEVQEIIASIRQEIAELGQTLVSISFSSVVGVITVLVYLILMPLLVFFFLKDKRLILNYLLGFLPRDRRLADTVWRDMDRQIANYVRGKFWEIVIVWGVSSFVFSVLGLQYAVLLGVLVGLSVIIPYIGAAVVTFPVILIAWFQWGWGSEFITLTVAYFIIQILDGNVLVPVLFSEAVNLHPVAIIVAILVFGGLWGLWGVFFAIPLATLVQAIISAWPTVDTLDIQKQS